MSLVKRSDDPTRGEDHNESLVDDAVGAQQERMNLIITACEELGADDMTGNGVPKVEVLEELTGMDNITAKERDDAWASFNG